MADKEASTIDLNALGQAIDTTWGRSSTTGGSSQSVKVMIKSDHHIEVTYRAIVNMVDDKQARDMKEKYLSESNDVIVAAVKKIKADYKELSGSSLKAKKIGEGDSLEYINLNIYNRKRTAYYKRNVIFEIS